MAGSGAKVIYYGNTNNSANNLNTATSVEYYTRPTVFSQKKFSQDIMENDIVDQLGSPNLARQLQALDDLRLTARRNGGCFPYTQQGKIFEALSFALADNKQDVRLQCTQLIHELIPQYGENLDECMSCVIAKLVPNLGDSTIAIRRATIQTLHVYMKYTPKLPQLLQAIVQYGLENPNPNTKKEVIIALPMLFTPEFSQEDFFHVASSLAKKLLDSNLGEGKIKDHILLSLDKIRTLVGDQVYGGYIQKLSAPLRKYYLKLTNNNDYQNEQGHSPSLSQSRQNEQEQRQHSTTVHTAFENSPAKAEKHFHQSGTKEFGVVPSQVMDKLNDQTNYRTRAQAVEELKGIIRDLDGRDLQNLKPNVHAFITYLNNLLDDSNFKITTVTLEVLGILVGKFGEDIRPHLKPMTSCLTKRMGDNKIVIRQAIMKVVMQLMQKLSPTPVLQVITDNLCNRNSRTRQETLNIIIASLLTFPSYSFDLSHLCASIAHTLVDPKRQVRQAALECFAAIAQAMGPGKLQPLVQAVDSVELSSEGDGVMAAVQARLTRRQLPKLNSDGLVDYATPAPSSGSGPRGAGSSVTSPDIEWIFLGSGGSGNSARSYRSESIELESLASNSARSTPSNLVQNSPSHGSTPRRHPSAGKGRSKLPWEDDTDGSPNNQIDDISPHNQSRHKQYAGDDFDNEMKRLSKKKVSSRDQSPEPGTYSKIHRNKYRRQTSDGSPSAYAMHSSISNPDMDYNNSMGNRTSLTPEARATSALASVSVPRTEVIEPINAHPWSAHSIPDHLNALDVRSLVTIPSPKPFLSPITDSPTFAAYLPDWGEASEERKGNKSENALIPTKPTLARGVSSKRKVPPIPVDTAVQYHDDEFHDTGQDDDDDYDEFGDNNEMTQSLRKIRNSASKKKVQKIFEQAPSDNNQNNSQKGKQKEMPFETKPRLARKTNPSPMREHALSSNSQSNMAVNPEGRSEFNPHGGVTFQKNSNLEVELVGRGYNDEATLNPDSRPLPTLAAKAREKKRTNAPKNMTSPLGMASTSNYGAAEMDDDRLPGGIVGKGMFDNGSSPTDHMSSNNGYDPSRRPSQMPADMPPHGVYGVKVRSMSQSSEDDSNEDANSWSMSKTTKDRLEQKSRQRQEEAEYLKQLEIEQAEREKREIEQARREKKRLEQEKIRKEKERQQEKLKKLSNQSEQEELQGLAISGNAQQNGGPPFNNIVTSPEKKSSTMKKETPKRKTKPVSQNADPPSHPSSAKSGEPEAISDLKPFNDGNAAYSEAMKMISNDEWDVKCTGINNIRRIVVHHPQVLIQNLHTVNVAIINEVKNLRSQVSRLAIICLGDMYAYLKRNMDLDLDQTSRVILAKNADSSGFIRADVDQTISAMVDNVTPQRALLALIASGTSHKNIAVRNSASYHLGRVVEIMGPGRVLSGVKDITDKVLPVAAQFLLDPSSDVRYNGQRILYSLMSHEDFEKMLTKFVPNSTLRNVQDKIDNLKKKGLVETASARARRSGIGAKSGSLTNSRGSSATSDHTSQKSAGPRKVRSDEATMEEINIMCGLMSASDWRDRQKGVQQLLDMAQESSHIVGNNIVKIFDKFVPCLKDSNSKVNLFALQCLETLVPILKDYMSGVATLTIQTVTSNISSKNNDIYSAASTVLDIFMENLDPCMILHPFANQAQIGNGRIKPDMISRVAFLTNEVYYKKQKQVILHVLPLLWHLLGATPSSGAIPGGTGKLRSSTSALIQTLYSCMGHSLMEHAQNTSTVTPRMLQTLQDMIDSP